MRYNFVQRRVGYCDDEETRFAGYSHSRWGGNPSVLNRSDKKVIQLHPIALIRKLQSWAWVKNFLIIWVWFLSQFLISYGFLRRILAMHTQVVSVSQHAGWFGAPCCRSTLPDQFFPRIFHDFQRISADFPWISMGFPWIFDGFPWIFKDFRGFSMEFPWISADFPLISIDFPWIFDGFPRIL